MAGWCRYSLRLQQNDNIINIIKSFVRGFTAAGFLATNLLINANCFHIVLCLLKMMKVSILEKLFAY